MQIAICNVGNQECSVHIEDVKEIICKEKISKIPDLPEYIEGMINLRGQVFVVYDLRKKFHLEYYCDDNSKIVIFNYKNIGFIVDEVIEIIEVDESDFDKKPQLPDLISKKFISNIVKVGERVIVDLDIERILDAKEEELIDGILEGEIEQLDNDI